MKVLNDFWKMIFVTFKAWQSMANLMQLGQDILAKLWLASRCLWRNPVFTKKMQKQRGDMDRVAVVYRYGLDPLCLQAGDMRWFTARIS